jgi:hypothetical protein
MRTTGEFRTHLVEVQMRKAGDTFSLIPFGDVHRDSPHCAVERWRDDLAEWKKIKNALFLGIGDYTDFLSTSERCRLRSGDGMHESTTGTLDVLARKQITGNHYYQFQDGTTGDHLLANQLNTKFLGVAAFVRVVFRWPGGNSRTAALDIFAHHGAGTGQKPHTSLGAVARMAEWADADIILQGHDHKRGVLPLNPTLHLSQNNNGALHVKERERWVGRCGSYLKAYIDGEAGYNVDAGRGPCSLGHIRFDITPIRERGDGRDIQRLKIRAIQ